MSDRYAKSMRIMPARNATSSSDIGGVSVVVRAAGGAVYGREVVVVRVALVGAAADVVVFSAAVFSSSLLKSMLLKIAITATAAKIIPMAMISEARRVGKEC